jgi:hypothetical protein
VKSYDSKCLCHADDSEPAEAAVEPTPAAEPVAEPAKAEAVGMYLMAK